MALVKDRMYKIPNDAVILTENEAFEYQWKLLSGWKRTGDVFGFKYGIYALAASSFLSGYYINNYYRRKLKLLHYGRMASYLPICVIPTVLSTFLHFQFVLRNVVLQKDGQCPICLQMRAAAFQSFIGCVFPAILAPISTLGIAQRYALNNLPYITIEPMKVLKIAQKITLPMKNVYFGMFIGHALLASTAVYYEAKSVYNVNMKLAMLEHDVVAKSQGEFS